MCKAGLTMILLLTLMLTGAVYAQTKLSGELKCEKGEPTYSLPVGDRPDHIFRMGKTKCTSPKPFVIEGISSVSEDITYFAEITGNKSLARSRSILTMSNGDKCYVGHQANEIVKNDVFESSEVKWIITGGTGKLRGLSAKGTSKCKGAADGTVVCAVEGEYQLKK